MSDEVKENWFLLDYGLCPPAQNMAMDEALLEHVATLRAPVLRFYGWTEPAATFGYFQRYADVELMTGLRPLLRRPTGGGLVPHKRDWTYSVVFPPGHRWYELKAEESYRQVHEWIRDAFARLGMATELSPCCQKDMPGQCFIGAEKYDLLYGGKKIAGAAQRRNKLGLLIQGSVQPPPERIQRSDWQKAMLEVPAKLWDASWSDLTVSTALNSRTDELIATRYALNSYNRKR